MLTSVEIPSSCFTQTWVSTPPGNLLPGLLIGNPYDTRCFPVGVDTALSLTQCPQGYVSACAPTSTLEAGATIIDCCPNGYACDGGFFKCTSAIGGTVKMTVTDVDSSQNPITKTTTTNGMNAHSLRIKFESSDLVSTTSSSSTSTTSGTSSATPSSTTSLPTSTSVPSESPSEGLTTGAKAGIGVGVGVGAIAILGIAFFLFRRRGRKSDPAAELDFNPAFQPPPPHTHTHTPAPTPTPTPAKYPSELDSSTPMVFHEMESPDTRYDSHR